MGVKPILISVAFSISFLMAGAQGRWILTNQKGVSLSYDKEFFLSCDENKSNVYKITAYFANNSGKSILISGALLWHGTTYYVTHCWSKVPRVMGEAEFKVNDVWPTQSLLTIVYYIELPQTMKTVPEPIWNVDPFTFVETPKTTQPLGQEVHTTTKPRSGIWETKKNEKAKIELTDRGLIFTFAGIDFNFSKITEDDYEWVKGKYIHIKFSDPNNFAILEYGKDYYRDFTYKSNIPLSGYDPSSNCCDVSFFEGEWSDIDKKTKINITANENGFTLKKQNSSILYQYTLNPMLQYHYNQGKGVFLRMSIRNPNKIDCEGIYRQDGYFSEAFYTRLKPIKDTVRKLETPIVKKEEKSAAIVKQENKPVSPSDISGDWRTEDGSITLTLLVKDVGLYAKIKGNSDETALLYKKISATEYRIDYSTDTYEIVKVISSDKMETHLYGPNATYPNGKPTQFLYRVTK